MNGEMLMDNVITLGYRRGEHVHLICTDKGLNMLPEPFLIEKNRNLAATMVNDVLIAATVPNVVALRLIGVITDGDATKILEGVPRPRPPLLAEELK